MIFGICNQSQLSMIDWLIKGRYINNAKDIYINPVGSDVKRKRFMFITIHDMLGQTEALNEMKGSIIFLFASPLRLRELSNIILLDQEEQPDKIGFGYNMLKFPDKVKFDNALQKLAAKKAQKFVRREQTRYLTHLIHSACKGSILSPLMTVIYALPSGVVQNSVKMAIFDVMVSGKPLNELPELLQSSSEYRLSALYLKKFQNILESDIGQQFLNAIKVFKTGKKTLSVVSKEHGVSLYELTYITSVHAKGKRYKVLE